MRKEADPQGGARIFCENLNCLSNGGTNDAGLSPSPVACPAPVKPEAPHEPATFRDLVVWATWAVIKGITSGQPLERSMHLVLDYARRWKPADEGRV